MQITQKNNCEWKRQRKEIKMNNINKTKRGETEFVRMCVFQIM